MTTSAISSTRPQLLPDDLDEPDSGRNSPSPAVHCEANVAEASRLPRKGPFASASSDSDAHAPSADSPARASDAMTKGATGTAVSTVERLVALGSAHAQTRPADGHAKEGVLRAIAEKSNRADLQAQSQDTLQRIRRTPPPPTASPPQTGQIGSTFYQYNGSASANNGLGFAAMREAAQQPDALPDHCAGLVTSSFYNIATGRASNLRDINSYMRDRLADPRTRQGTLAEIDRMQERNTFNIEDDMPGFVARTGEFGIKTGDELRSMLESEFGLRHSSDDGRGSYQTTMMPVTIGYRNPPDFVGADGVPHQEGHMIAVQRLNPSEHYESDHYQIYDPNYGTFDYLNFAQMATGMDNLLHHGYPQHGGVAYLNVAPYAAESTWQPYDDSSPQRSPLANASFASLDDVHLQGGGLLALASASPPRPDAEPPGSPPRDELRRAVSAVPNPQPYALFRPSKVTPEQMKQAHGFSLADTRMQNVNLNLHNFQLAANPAAVDGAGYLGTFRGTRAAKRWLSAAGQKSGYLYAIAPSPNMVDVHGSLGKGDRTPGNREVAAMGRIDSAQVRGWRSFENGKLGSYVANPDYRPDLFDHTRTAGAQPQLARFTVDDPKWVDDDHRSFVSEANRGGTLRYVPNENPALTAAAFYQRARDKIQYLDNQQAHGENYRGSVSIKPFFNNNDGKGNTRLNFYGGNSYPSVDSSYSRYSSYEFAMGDDGRIHSARDPSKVLRIDGNGNAYIGSIPQDPANINGVFAYNPASGGLLHVEDNKWLTEGISAYTPYVAVPQARNGQLASRQSWRLANAKGDAVEPPPPRAAFRDSSVGTSQQIYQFYHDPDTALPKGSTRFVTDVPGMTHAMAHAAAYAGHGETFLQAREHLESEEVSGARAWLAAHNAAWLFRDGLYAVPAAPNQLEVRTIGGTPVWRISVDPIGQRVQYQSLQSEPHAPPLRFADPIWKRLLDQQARYVELENRAKQFYM